MKNTQTKDMALILSALTIMSMLFFATVYVVEKERTKQVQIESARCR